MEPNLVSPVERMDLAAGATKTLDLALKAVEPKSDVELVDFDTLYPPGSGRDVLIAPSPDLPEQQRELLIECLASNFGPNAPRRDLKKDQFQVDEDAIADALY